MLELTNCAQSKLTILKIISFVKYQMSSDDEIISFFQSVSQIENVNRRQNFLRMLNLYKQKVENLLRCFAHVIEEALKTYDSQ